MMQLAPKLAAAVTAALCVLAPGVLAAATPPDTPPETPIAAMEILAIDFADGRLSGPGGERLRADLAGAQFIALGEDHGLAGPPQLAAALARAAEAVPGAAPLHHAVEVGPLTTELVQQVLAKGGIAALDQMLEGRALAMPFLSLVEDAVLAESFARKGRLFGIDQEFIGAPMLLAPLLAERTKDAALRDRLLAMAKADGTTMAAGQFNALSLTAMTGAQYAELRRQFADDRKAQAIIDALAESAEIYRLNNSGRYLENNEVRTDLIQRLFLKSWSGSGAKRPRVLLKMGASHMGRGTTPPAIYDIGSLLPGLAASLGRRSLHIAYLPLGGKIRVIRPSPAGLTAVSDVDDKIVAPLLAAAGIDPSAIPATGHVLIPLAAVRHKAAAQKQLRGLPEYARFVALGFDYLVTTRDAAPATSFEAN